MQSEITYRKVEEKDKENLYHLFQTQDWSKVGLSYSTLGLEQLTDDKLLERMIEAESEVIIKGDKFLGVIETTPYDENTIEIRLAMEKFDDIPLKETETATQVFILNQLKKHGVSRIIIEVYKQFDLAIEHLLASGYRVVSTINDAVTFEYDFSNFNKGKA